MQREEYQKMSQMENKHWWYIAKKILIGTIFKKYFRSRSDLKILDGGSGTGGMSMALKKYGKLTCLELHSEAVLFSTKRGLKVVQGSINKMPFKNKCFDLVTFFDCLYHKNVDDNIALKEANRVLKERSYLLITDCANKKIWGKHDELMHARERYSLNEMESKVEKAGFEIIKRSYIYFFTFPLFYAVRIMEKFSGKYYSQTEINPVFNQILLFICRFEAYLLKYINFPFGSSILFLARKK